MVWYHFQVDYDDLKMWNLKTATFVTKQGVITKKQKDKMDHIICLIHKMAEKYKKSTMKNRWDK